MEASDDPVIKHWDKSKIERVLGTLHSSEGVLEATNNFLRSMMTTLDVGTIMRQEIAAKPYLMAKALMRTGPKESRWMWL